MSNVLVEESCLQDIANAIRAKNNKTDKYLPNQMTDAIKALALDNSVVIQSNDAWKYAIDSTLEHQSLTVNISSELTGDNTTGYKGKVIFDPYITSNFGWIAGKIKHTVDSTNHIITFSAEAATEISNMLQDGWTPVYIVDKKYYTTTTPDDVNSFKSISKSDNIENILICGYYKKDSITGKLSSTNPSYIGEILVSSYTKKFKNTYVTSIGDNAFEYCSSLTSIDVSNATSIGKYAFIECSSLTSIDLSNATSIGYSAFTDCFALTSIDLSNATKIGEDDNADISINQYSTPNLKYIVIDSNTVSKAHVELWSGVKVLIPQSMMDAYSSDSYWSSYTSQLDAIENYTITRENGQITITKKVTLTKLNFTVNKTTTRETAYFSTEYCSPGPTCTLVNFNPETGKEANIFSIGPDGASLVLDTTGSSEAIRVLRNYDLKLIFYGAEINGEFNRYNYTKDQKIVTTAGTFTRDIIEFTSYREYEKPLYKLITAFNNGQDLDCVISLLKK